MLGAADLYGGRPTEVSGAHPPLAPAPCATEPFRSDAGRIDTRAITANVMPEPLGERDVVVNLDRLYTLDRPGLLRRCGELGCHPAPTGCTSDSYFQAARDADAPEHSYHRERGCDRKWLVMDISISSGPVCERPGDCAGASGTTRYFYRATPTGWRVIAATTTPGCDDVRSAEPRFPRTLCAKLTAP